MQLGVLGTILSFFVLCTQWVLPHPHPLLFPQATFKRLLTGWCWPWGKEPLLFAHKLDKNLNFPSFIFRHGAWLLRMLIGLIWMTFVFHWNISRKMQIFCLLRKPRPFRLILWRACNLTWFSPCLTGPVDYLFASRHKGHRFKSPGGTYVKPGFSC